MNITKQEGWVEVFDVDSDLQNIGAIPVFFKNALIKPNILETGFRLIENESAKIYLKSQQKCFIRVDDSIENVRYGTSPSAVIEYDEI